MIGILIEGEFLDINPDTKMEIKIRHNIYDGGDPTIKRGSYVIPFTVPLTPHNKKLLKQPHLIANREPLLIDSDAVIYLSPSTNYGIPWRSGKLYITESTDKAAQITITINSISDLGDLTFKDIELDFHSEADATAMQTHAQDTLDNPLNYNHAFIPIKNPDFIDDADRVSDRAPDATHWETIQNLHLPFDGFTDPVDTNIKNRIVTPFLRVDYLLSLIGQPIGFSVENLWHTTDEKKLTYLHNVQNLFENGSWPSTIYYRDLVPDIKLNDFIKHMCAWDFIGIFPDVAKKNIVIRPLVELLTEPHYFDWTKKIRKGHGMKTDVDMPYQFGYDGDNNDKYERPYNPAYDYYVADLIPDYYQIELPEPVLDIIALGQGYHRLVDDTYYRTRIATYPGWGFNATAYWAIEEQFFDRIDIGGQGKEYLCKVSPLFMKDLYMYCQKSGSGKYFKYNDALDPVSDTGGAAVEFGPTHEFTQKFVNDKNLRIFLYRGMKPINGVNFPVASNNAYNIETELEDYEYSLLMNRPAGVYDRNKSWIEFLKNKKEVTYSVDLSLTDLLNIREDRKVRIGNMNYFIKEITTQVQRDKILASKVTLVSTT